MIKLCIVYKYLKKDRNAVFRNKWRHLIKTIKVESNLKLEIERLCLDELNLFSIRDENYDNYRIPSLINKIWGFCDIDTKEIISIIERKKHENMHTP